MAVRLCAVLFMYNDILFLIMKHSLRSISLTLAFFAFGSAFAQGPNGSGTYYIIRLLTARREKRLRQRCLIS